MSNANFTASSSLFSVNLESNPDSTEDFSMDKALEVIRDYLVKKYTLTCQPIINVTDGQLLVLTSTAESPNTKQPKFVTMIEIDPVVLDRCREHLRGACGDTLDNLEGENYKVIVDDCLKYLYRYGGEGRKFDYIINDLTDIPLSSEKTEVGRDLWNFVKSVLNKSFKCLKPGGSFHNHAVGTGWIAALNAYEEVLNELPFKVKFTRSNNWVPSFLEDWVFYQITVAEVDQIKSE